MHNGLTGLLQFFVGFNSRTTAFIEGIREEVWQGCPCGHAIIRKVAPPPTEPTIKCPSQYPEMRPMSSPNPVITLEHHGIFHERYPLNFLASGAKWL